MKVITNTVVIRNEEFVLIEDTQKGKHFFGTIPYSCIDENGRMKEVLNGFQMCIDDTPAEAIANRERAIITAEWKEKHPDATEMEFMQFVVSLFRK